MQLKCNNFLAKDENMANISYVPRIGAEYLIRSDSGLARSRSEPANGIKTEIISNQMTPPTTLEEMDAYDAKIFESPTTQILPGRVEQAKDLAHINVDGHNTKWPTKTRLTRHRKTVLKF